VEHLRKLGVEVLVGDLADAQFARIAVRGREVVLNAIGLAADYGKFDVFYKANVLATESVLGAAIDANVRRFVHASSYVVSLGGSFHHWRGWVITEQAPERPRFWRWDYYCRTKVPATCRNS